MKAIFDASINTPYEDDLPRAYHFPQDYLSVAERSVGDWVIFRRPRAGGGDKAYFAVALLSDLHDLKNGFFNAILDQFLPFEEPVSWRQDGVYREERLRGLLDIKDVGRTLRGASVREVSQEDFLAIVSLGLRRTFAEHGINDPILSSAVEGNEHIPIEVFTRRVTSALQNKKVRLSSFRKSVLSAYDYTCAFTGLCLVDEAGDCEAEAAHLWSVEHGGPDVVQNGIALCGTAHWLFDRGWIVIADDLSLQIVKPNIPEQVRALFAPQLKRIRVPKDGRLHPHPYYLAKKRNSIFPD